MLDPYILVGLLICLVLIPPLKHWISVHVQGIAFLLTDNIRVARLIFWFIMFPGICLHEVSHWLMAHLLWVKPLHFSLKPEIKDDGWMQLGGVQLQGPIDPFRHSLVGLAPLISGCLAILLIGQIALDIDNLAYLLTQNRLEPIISHGTDLITQPLTWLWFYLIFAISNAMFPSPIDRQAWATALIYSLLLFIIVLAFGLTSTLMITLHQLFLATLATLWLAFSLTLVVDICFILLIVCVETCLSWMIGRQVIYN